MCMCLPCLLYFSEELHHAVPHKKLHGDSKAFRRDDDFRLYKTTMSFPTLSFSLCFIFTMSFISTIIFKVECISLSLHLLRIKWGGEKVFNQNINFLETEQVWVWVHCFVFFLFQYSADCSFVPGFIRSPFCQGIKISFQLLLSGKSNYTHLRLHH